MKVLNGKKSTLVYQLDSGQTLRVQPGQFSDPFIGTVALVRAIISSGTPKQVGFVVSNSYELNVIKELPVAQSYYHATEEEAKAAILEGKDFSRPESTNPLEMKVKDLESQLLAKDKEIEELKLDISKSSSVSEEDYNYLKKQLADKESEINSLKSRNDSLFKQAEDLTAEVTSLKNSLADVQSRYEKSSTELLEANNKLKAAVEAKPEVQRNADGQTLDEVTDLFKKLKEQIPIEIKGYEDKIDELTSQLQASQANSITAEEVEKLKEQLADVEEGRQRAANDVITLKSQLEAKDTEIATLKTDAEDVISKKQQEIDQLKADGAVVFENYTKAKSAVQEIMQKFGITYIDGQYVKQAN